MENPFILGELCLEDTAKKYDPSNPKKDFNYWFIQYDFIP